MLFCYFGILGSGVSGVIAESRTNPEVIISQLRQGERMTSTYVKRGEGSAVFFAILKASQSLPRNSAIILFTDRNPIDEDLSQLSVHYLTSNFIQVHTDFF